MDRRTFLRTAGTALAAAGLAGCNGGGDGGGGMRGRGPGNQSGTGSPGPTDPVPNLELGLPKTSESDSGNLVVTIPVENVGDSKGAGTLVVKVRAGDRNYQQTRAVSLPSGEKRTVEIEFDVAYDEYVSDGALNFDWKTN